MELTFDRVTKFYGAVIGLNAVTCRIGPGITGLLGSNGAGKSTLMKLASGQLRPTQGDVRIGGRRPWTSAAKRSFGYSPDIDGFYEEMPGGEFVYILARLNGYPRGEARRRTDEALAEVGMSELAHRKLGGCSHGMRQRIKLAQALVHDPQVLLLDEPLAGIDPAGRREINELLVRLAARGKTVLVSSHILGEIEQLADTILILSRGRVMASGTLAELRGLLDERPLTVEIACDEPRRLAPLLAELPEVRSVEIRDDDLLVRTRHPDRFFALCGRLFVEHRLAVSKLLTLDAGADAVFGYLERGSA